MTRCFLPPAHRSPWHPRIGSLGGEHRCGVCLAVAGRFQSQATNSDGGIFLTIERPRGLASSPPELFQAGGGWAVGPAPMCPCARSCARVCVRSHPARLPHRKCRFPREIPRSVCFSVPPCRFPWGKNHARRRPHGLTPYSPKLSRPRGRVLQAFGLSCAHTGAWRARARAPKAPACGVHVRPPAAWQRGARVCASRRDCPVPTRLGRGKFTCVFSMGVASRMHNGQRPPWALGSADRFLV